MKFPEWLPDRDDFENPGLTECQNVIPDTFYRPIRSLVASGAAMDGVCLGAFSTKDDTGESYNFAGDATKLYERDSGDWSSTNTGYVTGTENRWRFKRFGDLIIATNRSDVVQKWDISTDTSFSALGGTPPKAEHIGIVRDFVVLANTDNAANEVRWSGINDAEEWTAGTAESGSQIMPEGGQITGVIGGEYGLIFQENQITRMEYQGPPLNFSFDVIETGIGAMIGGSIVRFGVNTYYLSNNGFYVTDGTQSRPISTTKIDKHFFSKLDETKLYKMTSTIDPINKLVIWSYVGQDSLDEMPNWLMIYNWELGRWSEVSLSHELVYNSLSSGYTLEGLDALYADLDTMPISLDSRILQGGTLVLAAIDTTHKTATFTGDVLAGKLKTGEFELNPLKKSIVTQIWPEIDGTNTVTIEIRETFQDSVSSSGAVTVNSYGFAPFTKNGRYHSFQFDFTDWSRATGFKIVSGATGGY
jgi:hypothetical protein